LFKARGVSPLLGVFAYPGTMPTHEVPFVDRTRVWVMRS